MESVVTTLMVIRRSYKSAAVPGYQCPRPSCVEPRRTRRFSGHKEHEEHKGVWATKNTKNTKDDGARTTLHREAVASFTGRARERPPSTRRPSDGSREMFH